MPPSSSRSSPSAVVTIIGSWRPNWAPLSGAIMSGLRDLSIPALRVPATHRWIQRILLTLQTVLILRLLRRRLFVITSDHECLNICHSVPRIRFFWNTASELAEAPANTSDIASFFISPECLQSPFSTTDRGNLDWATIETYTYAPPIMYRFRKTAERRSSIFFASEVTTPLPVELATMIPNKDQLRKLDARIWEMAQASLGDHATHRRLTPEIFDTPAIGSGLQWLLINRIRFLYVTELKRRLGTRLIIWGTDWQAAGLSGALPSNFNIHALSNEYRSNRACLDLGGKSCHAPVYPRLSDIFRAGGLPVQASMTDTAHSWPTFNSIDQATEKLERVLEWSSADYWDQLTAYRQEYSRISHQACRELNARIHSRIQQSLAESTPEKTFQTTKNPRPDRTRHR